MFVEFDLTDITLSKCRKTNSWLVVLPKIVILPEINSVAVALQSLSCKRIGFRLLWGEIHFSLRGSYFSKKQLIRLVIKQIEPSNKD